MRHLPWKQGSPHGWWMIGKDNAKIQPQALLIVCSYELYMV